MAWIAVLLLVAGGVWLTVSVIRKERRITLRGVVLRQDSDPSKQAPIAGADISAITGDTASQAKSGDSGLFSVTLPRGFRRRQPITLQVQHPNYQPLEFSDFIGDKLYIVRMRPTSAVRLADGRPAQVISNVRLRYVVRSMEIVQIGSAVKTFQVTNTGNLPCKKPSLCSPDGKWKAATASISLDAGEGNEFRNVRTSCIAGPCPFTRIDQEAAAGDGRHLNLLGIGRDGHVFLVEAEVIHPMVSEKVRESYPVILGRSLSFTLPASAEGPSLEVELSGEAIVFPLGPNLSLRWAQCTEERVITRTRCTDANEAWISLSVSLASGTDETTLPLIRTAATPCLQRSKIRYAPPPGWARLIAVATL